MLTGPRSDVMLTFIFGILFVVAGLTLSTRSGILEVRAAGRRQIPLWKSNPEYRRPRASILVQVAAALLVGIGAAFLLIVWGSGAILLISLVYVPPFVVVAIHNKSTRGGK